MAKKSFKNNPALQFITAAQAPQEKPAAPQTPQNPKNLPAEPVLAPRPASSAPKAKKPSQAKNGAGEGTASQKPPAAATPAPAAVAAPARQSPPPAAVPVKLNPMYIETRSKRVQLLMQPSLHDKLRATAAKTGQSLNDLVHMALERFVDEDMA